VNAYWEGLDFQLPALPKGWLWVQVANTGLEAPNDIYDAGTEKPISPGEKTFHAGPRSVAILMSNQK
jgi:glycogen operon protein